MTAAICGSFAFDTIMVFQDKFANHILPEQVHILNVSFQVPEMRREFGGCAGNIAYNLKLLGGDALPVGTVGRDFTAYEAWLNRCEIDCRYVVEIPESYTAQAFIITDLADNQITAFHPGAMNFSHQNSVLEIPNLKMGMISPDGRDGMIIHAKEFAQMGVPFFFDPGQGTILFSGKELVDFIDQAAWMTVNDYEWKLIQERTGLSVEEAAKKLQALIITKGGDGSLIYHNNQCFEIPSVPIKSVQDPTGCGDAYRGGLLFGLQKGLDWETSGRIASLMGAIKIEHAGTQNHHFTFDEFQTRFKESFGYDLGL
jgi:adenosine kinase